MTQRYYEATYEFEVDSPGALNGKERVRADVRSVGEFERPVDALIASLDQLRAEIERRYGA